MVKSYYVKDKRKTECVPGSERIVKTKASVKINKKTKKTRKNPSRTIMTCICAECGVKKTKFIKDSGN